MVNPSGYTALDLVGFTDRGPYDPNYNYVANDLAHHAGSIWCCLIDDTMGIEPTAGVNWRFWVKDSQEGISDIVNILGAKNLLDVTPRLKAEPSARSYLSYDGQIITVNGTVSTSEYTRLNGVDGTFTLPKGEYIFSGTSSNSDIKLALRKNGTEFVLSQNPNATFTSDGDTNTFTFLINVKAGTYTNETVKAMIRPSGIEDDTWQPYTKTNKELTAEVTQNTSDIQTLTNSIAPIEDGTNYSQSYSKDQLFYHNGSLCYVTASSVNSSTAINIGESGNAKYCTLEWYLSNMELGVRLEHTWQASELANVSSGSIQVINRDGICCVKCVDLVCTADTPLLYIGGYVGNVYEYDIDNSGLYIDNGNLYSKNANVGMRILTFVR